MINVIITDDHPIVRTGLKQILDECNDIDIIDEASSGSDLLKMLTEEKYDVLLLDISLPDLNGLDLLKEIRDDWKDLFVLILSVYSEEQYAIRALKLGASGYLSKSSTPEELISAIRKVATGGKYITGSLAEKIADSYTENEETALHHTLSTRELEVLCLLAEGKTVTHISRELSLSIKTISTYRERILLKLNLKTTSDLIRYAISEGLVV